MDPNATLNELLDAIYAADADAALDAAEALVEWIDSGGFAPTDPRERGGR